MTKKWVLLEISCNNPADALKPSTTTIHATHRPGVTEAKQLEFCYANENKKGGSQLYNLQ